MFNAALVFLQTGVCLSDLFSLNSVYRIIYLLLPALRRHLSTNLIRSPSHSSLYTRQRLIFLNERLQVGILPDGSGLLVTLSNGIACLVTPFTLKALNATVAHIVS